MSYFGNNLNNRKKESQLQSEEQGQVRSSDSEPEDGEINGDADEHQEREQQIFESDSSDDDKQRREQYNKKREDFWKTRNQQKPEAPQGQFNLLQYAYEAAAKTNKRILILRKKNEKRIEELESLRMMQQPYLMAANTHYRGSLSQYPLLTIDERGKTYLHPNSSLRVSQSKLDHFIQKNIAQQNTSNYLNEVVKFQNFAYQHRKKRRHNFQ